MCGIYGSPHITPDVECMLPHLAVAMEQRGTDAWGASNGVDILRQVGPIHATWWEKQGQMGEWRAGIFHTRGASVGNKDQVENAHPFTYERPDGGRVIGIHNGGIRNYAYLNGKYQRNATCDSMHLWMHRAAGLPWEDLYGTGAMAWWEVPPPGGGESSLLIARVNSTSLHCGRVGDGGIVFASTYTSLVTSALMVGSRVESIYPLVEGVVYRLTAEGVFETGEKVAFGVEQSPVSLRSTLTHHHHPFLSTPGGGGVCGKCGFASASKEYLLCSKCFLYLYSQWRRTHPEHQKSPVARMQGAVGCVN